MAVQGRIDMDKHDEILERIARLEELENKLLKIDVLIDERDKHHDKLKEIIRKGW